METKNIYTDEWFEQKKKQREKSRKRIKTAYEKKIDNLYDAVEVFSELTCEDRVQFVRDVIELLSDSEREKVEDFLTNDYLEEGFWDKYNG